MLVLSTKLMIRPGHFLTAGATSDYTTLGPGATWPPSPALVAKAGTSIPRLMSRTMEQTSNKSQPLPLRALAVLAALLIIVGLVLGFAYPSPITGALLPIGLTLWWLAFSDGDTTPTGT